MHCGVMVTGYNQGDWERLLAEDYSRPPAVSDVGESHAYFYDAGIPGYEEYLDQPRLAGSAFQAA